MKPRSKTTGQFVNSALKKQKDAKPDQVVIPPEGRGPNDSIFKKRVDTPATMAEQYPTDGLMQREADDRLNEIKYRLQKDARGQDTGITPFGKLDFNDKVAYWILRKEEAAKKAAFQAWFAALYDKMGPAQKAEARKLYPQFYTERLKTLDTNLDTLRQLARIRIHGVQTQEDLALEFAADNGLLPMDILANILHPEKRAAQAAQSFKRGLFNTNTWFMGSDGSFDSSGNSTMFHGSKKTLTPTFPISRVTRGNVTNTTAARTLGLI